MKKYILLVVLTGSLTQIFAQNDATQKQSLESKKNSIELNLIWPFIPKIYQIKYARRIIQFKNEMQGEFIVSANYRSWSFLENEGNKTMFSVAFGYRHYWWKGINSELSLYPEFVRIKNNVVDGKSYSDFYVVPEFYTGYKGKLGKKALFYNIQLGTGIILFPDESYPRLEETSIFFNGNLTLGYSF